MFMLKSALCGATFAALCLSNLPGPARASVFDIRIDFTFEKGSGLGREAQKQAVRDTYAEAETLWESLITGYQLPDEMLTGIQINSNVIPIDGRGKILGRAGPTHVYNPSLVGDGSYLTHTGLMEFDGADARRLLKRDQLLGVVLHEMAHVIGFGTLWSYNDLYTNGSGQYIGEAAVAAYQDEFDRNANFVPVELGGGGGTANAHWDENWAGGSSDVMTGYLSSNLTYSNTTIHAFRDLGYTTVNSYADALALASGVAGANAALVPSTASLGNSQVGVIGAVPLPATSLALGAAVAALALIRRRRNT